MLIFKKQRNARFPQYNLLFFTEGMVTVMKKQIATKRFTALLLLVCMMISLLSRSFGVHAEDGEELRPDGSLPVVYLNIDESQGTIDDMITDPNHSFYCYGTLSIEVPEGFRYSDFKDVDLESVEGLSMSIRGRGNSTWQKSAKKAFKIKPKESSILQETQKYG